MDTMHVLLFTAKKSQSTQGRVYLMLHSKQYEIYQLFLCFKSNLKLKGKMMNYVLMDQLINILTEKLMLLENY